MLEIRLYSSVVLTLTQLDEMIDWDCTANPTYRFCYFCPGFITTATNTCLEDDY